MIKKSSKPKPPVPLNFHGHLLPGHIVALGDIILYEMKIDEAVARWCYYRLEIYGGGIGSAESVVIRTALRRLIEAIYNDWENVTTLLPVETVEAAVDEMQKMIEISKEFPVMLWQFVNADNPSQADWVTATKAKLPSLETLNEFFELPHMRHRFIGAHNEEFYRDDDREAEKAYRNALAGRNRRLNRAARELSRGKRKGLT